MKHLLLTTVLILANISPSFANSALPGLPDFIDEMQQKHGFDSDYLTTVFSAVEVKESILKAIARPAEKSKPWYDYRKIFITQKRIKGGVNFWKENEQALQRAEQEYGVPAEIIVAILGVETRYGGNVGSYRVVDALSTLAFRYPPRSKFFSSELEQFLLLTREEQMSILDPIGSYAGAMGLGQFMPSSYRAYAVDFDEDGKRDIWTNPTDAIGSIANYLNKHGWVADESIAHKTRISGQEPTALIEKGSKPSISRTELTTAGVSLDNLSASHDQLALIALTQKNGEEYWLTTQNFYSITRYNHSRMYAMAVTQLSEAIRERYRKQE